MNITYKMNFSSFIWLVLFITINNISGKIIYKGNKTSLVFLSNSTYFRYHSITDLFVFGDSLSSTQTDFRDMSIGRFTCAKGENWPIALSKLNDMKLWNFAISGAVIDPNIVPRKHYIYTYRDEQKYFIDRMAEGKIYHDLWDSDTSLFAFWLGSNDIIALNRTIYNNVINETLEKILDIYFDSFEKMYDVGARNFLLLNIQNLEPFSIIFKSDVIFFNNSLNKHAEKFFQLHNDTNIIVYDMNSEMKYIEEHYKDYNFVSGTSVWRNFQNDTVENYIWVDNLHSSFKTNDIFSNDIHDLLTENQNGSKIQRPLSKGWNSVKIRY